MFVASTHIYKKLSRERSNKIANKLISLLNDEIKILDFGCGNLMLSQHLLRLKPKMEITGLDIIEDINLNRKVLKQNLIFNLYSSRELPFNDNCFDAALASCSFHHTVNPEYYLKELIRVVKNGGHIILVEAMYINFVDKVWISTQDWLLNKIKNNISTPLQFRFYKHYKEEFERQNLEIVYENHIRPGFPFLHHYIFKLKVKK